MEFTQEIVGQQNFYDRFGLREYVTIDNNTDGYLTNGGTIFEFKKQIKSTDEVLFQAIKYLSKLRIKGQPIHKNIVLVSLNDEIVYCYNSNDFLSEIETVYFGGASKNNTSFSTGIQPKIINYSNAKGINDLLRTIDIDNPQFVKINIDVNCVVGWANRYYNETNGTKIELFEELRHPKVFKNYINEWKGNEDDFKFIMDCLNDLKNKRELGAFYTPKIFAKKSIELVRKAISMIPKNLTCKDKNCEFRYEGEKEHKHYIILDRCAGTGILQEQLSDEELSHTIVATYELKEWVVLNTLIGDKVKCIIPPIPNHKAGLLNGGDALAQEIFEQVKPYVNDKNCTIIMFENPPYDEAGGRSFYDQSSKNNDWKSSLICNQMKKEITGVASNDKTNLFIWSAFKHYLKKENDFYVLFSPIKYWKTQHLVDKKFIDGFYCNRGHFGNAGDSTVSVILWKNEYENLEELPVLPAYDIENNSLIKTTDIIIKRVNSPLSKIYDKREFDDDVVGVVCKTDGYEIEQNKYRTSFSVKPIDNDNIMGYLATHGFSPNSQGRVLTRVGMANGHGFYLRSDIFLKKLPLFVAGCFPENKWYRKDVYAKNSDNGLNFEEDNEFLKNCLIFTCLTDINKCISFDSKQNGKYYQNELCFDNGTIASKILKNFVLSVKEQSLITDFYVILEEAKKCISEYIEKYKYGIYQIEKEIDIEIIDIDKNTNMPIIDIKTNKPRMKPKHATLHGKFVPLKRKLAEYYTEEIEPKLFLYGLIK